MSHSNKAKATEMQKLAAATATAIFAHEALLMTILPGDATFDTQDMVYFAVENAAMGALAVKAGISGFKACYQQMGLEIKEMFAGKKKSDTPNPA